MVFTQMVPSSIRPSALKAVLNAHQTVSAFTQRARRPATRLASSNDDKNNGGGGGLGDDLLDFMYAGKKLRKWYGQEGQVLPRDGGPPKDDPEENDPNEDKELYSGPREYVLVLDADSSPMAEQVLLQLILARAKIKAVVKDAQAAKLSFGPYVDVLGRNLKDSAQVKAAFRGVQSLVLCGNITQALVAAAVNAGVPHLVLLSAVGAPPPSGFLFFRNAEMTLLEEKFREELVIWSGVAYTISRVGGLSDREGGMTSLELVAAQETPRGTVSREDAAQVVAQAALRDVSGGSLVFNVVAGGAGQPPQDWSSVFNGLKSVSLP